MYVVSFLLMMMKGENRIWKKEVYSRIRIRGKKMNSKKRRDGDLYIPYLTLP